MLYEHIHVHIRWFSISKIPKVHTTKQCGTHKMVIINFKNFGQWLYINATQFDTLRTFSVHKFDNFMLKSLLIIRNQATAETARWRLLLMKGRKSDWLLHRFEILTWKLTFPNSKNKNIATTELQTWSTKCLSGINGKNKRNV